MQIVKSKHFLIGVISNTMNFENSIHGTSLTYFPKNILFLSKIWKTQKSGQRLEQFSSGSRKNNNVLLLSTSVMVLHLPKLWFIRVRDFKCTKEFCISIGCIEHAESIYSHLGRIGAIRLYSWEVHSMTYHHWNVNAGKTTQTLWIVLK